MDRHKGEGRAFLRSALKEIFAHYAAEPAQTVSPAEGARRQRIFRYVADHYAQEAAAKANSEPKAKIDANVCGG